MLVNRIICIDEEIVNNTNFFGNSEGRACYAQQAIINDLGVDYETAYDLYKKIDFSPSFINKEKKFYLDLQLLDRITEFKKDLCRDPGEKYITPTLPLFFSIQVEESIIKQNN